MVWLVSIVVCLQPGKKASRHVSPFEFLRNAIVTTDPRTRSVLNMKLSRRKMEEATNAAQKAAKATQYIFRLNIARERRLVFCSLSA